MFETRTATVPSGSLFARAARAAIAASALLVGFGFTTTTANAALTAYEGFDYSAGDLTGKNGGTGWAGAFTDSGNSTVYDSTGLTYLNLQTSPGSARMNDGSGATTINFRSFSNVQGDGETETWISLLARRNGVTSTTLFAGLTLYNTGGIAAANAELAPSNTSADPGQWRILDSGVATSAVTSTVIAPDTTYLLVTRITWGVVNPAFANSAAAGASAVYFYVNPDLTTGTFPAAASAGRNIQITNLDKIRIAGQNAVDYSFDEIRIGDTFGDVTPVPEPTALATLGAGGVLGLLRRRRD